MGSRIWSFHSNSFPSVCIHLGSRTFFLVCCNFPWILSFKTQIFLEKKVGNCKFGVLAFCPSSTNSWKSCQRWSWGSFSNFHFHLALRWCLFLSNFSKSHTQIWNNLGNESHRLHFDKSNTSPIDNSNLFLFYGCYHVGANGYHWRKT